MQNHKNSSLKVLSKSKGFQDSEAFQKKTPSFQQPLGKPLSICSEPLGSPDFKGQCQGRHRVWKGKACCQQNGGEGLFGLHTCWLTLKSIDFIIFCMVAKLWTQRSVGCSEHWTIDIARPIKGTISNLYFLVVSCSFLLAFHTSIKKWRVIPYFHPNSRKPTLYILLDQNQLRRVFQDAPCFS